jgi:hypothetical protein
MTRSDAVRHSQPDSRAHYHSEKIFYLLAHHHGLPGMG